MSEDVASLVARRHRQLIVHSYLYYELGENIVSDHTFDAWRRELAELHRTNPDVARQAPYYDIGRHFVESPSGYFIATIGYPPELVSKAIQLLRYHDSLAKPHRA